MSSTSSSNKQKSSGFSAQEFKTFLTAGNRIGGSTSDIRLLTPQLQERTFTTSTEDGGTPKTSIQGFGGNFAKQGAGPLSGNVTEAQVNRLSSLFLNRQRQVQQKKAQPGRTGLFLNRSVE